MFGNIVVGIKIFGFFLGVFIIFLIDALSSIGFGFFQYVLYIFPLILIFLCLKNLYPIDLKLREKIIIHFIAAFFIIFIFEYSTKRFDRRLGLQQLKYPTSSCFQTFRGVMGSQLVHQSFQNLIESLNFMNQYFTALGQDYCRVARLKVIVKNAKPLSKICPTNSKVECYISSFDIAHAFKPFSATGLISFLSGITFFNKLDRAVLYEKVRSEKDGLIQSLELIQTQIKIINNYRNSVNIENLIKKFPTQEVKNIPNDLKVEIDQYKTNSAQTIKFDEFLKQLSDRNQKVQDINPKILKAYYIQTLENKLSDVFQNSFCQGMVKFLKDIDEKLENPATNIKKLNPDEIIEVRAKISVLQSQIVCKN